MWNGVLVLMQISYVKGLIAGLIIAVLTLIVCLLAYKWYEKNQALLRDKAAILRASILRLESGVRLWLRSLVAALAERLPSAAH